MNDFEVVGASSDLAEGGMLSIDVDGEMLIVFRQGGELFCLADVCTHDGGSLSDGDYCDFQIKCPRHGARFDIRTGKALCMPATQPTKTHLVREQDGQIFVKLVD